MYNEYIIYDYLFFIFLIKSFTLSCLVSLAYNYKQGKTQTILIQIKNKSKILHFLKYKLFDNYNSYMQIGAIYIICTTKFYFLNTFLF